jgi:hypothetical protein
MLIPPSESIASLSRLVVFGLKISATLQSDESPRHKHFRVPSHHAQLADMTVLASEGASAIRFCFRCDSICFCRDDMVVR